MRKAFISALLEVAEQDPRVALVVGDVGFGVVEPFARRFPSRFVNAGVAEQSMTGIAAGMALNGMVVFTYSIANFPVLRCLEQIRNDICYHNASVKVVSVGGGLAYGSLGMSHHATEDIAITRALPNMTVVAPGDPLEAAAATRALVEWEGPCYLRLGRAGEPVVHSGPIDFQIGRALTVVEGDDLTLIATGTMLPRAVEVAWRMHSMGLGLRVLSMHTVQPLDEEAVLRAVEETGALATLEEHSIIGGLGSAVAEVLAEKARRKVPFLRLGLPPAFASVAGSREFLLERMGLSVEAIVQRLTALVGREVPMAGREG